VLYTKEQILEDLKAISNAEAVENINKLLAHYFDNHELFDYLHLVDETLGMIFENPIKNDVMVPLDFINHSKLGYFLFFLKFNADYDPLLTVTEAHEFFQNYKKKSGKVGYSYTHVDTLFSKGTIEVVKKGKTRFTKKSSLLDYCKKQNLVHID